MLSAMSVLPDPAELLAIATRIAGHAQHIRGGREQVQARLVAAHWHGVAATAFRVQAEATLAALDSAAKRLDHAADLLHVHAQSTGTRLRHVLDAAADGATLGADLLIHPERVGHDLGAIARSGARVVGDTVDSIVEFVSP
jgi:hypothetical protein